MALAAEYQAHPWRGVPIGDDAPRRVSVFVVQTSADAGTYAIDMSTGYLELQATAESPRVNPFLYGFIPQTLYRPYTEGSRWSRTETLPPNEMASLPIYVIAQLRAFREGCLVTALPVGALRMATTTASVTAIIAVMEEDAYYGACDAASALPPIVLDAVIADCTARFVGSEDRTRRLLLDRQQTYDLIMQSHRRFHAHANSRSA